jgi:hypothetical protein
LQFAIEMPPDPPQSQIANRKSQILPWSVFLGVSWTWCIGMFLPVLLVRDYGVWGFVFFAIPNVIGAAAMGWTIRSPQHSAKLVAAHREACRAFSLVTIAFQIYFAGWFVRANSRLAASAVLMLVIVWLAWVSLRVMSNRPARGVMVASAPGVYVVSLTCLAVGLARRLLPSLPAAIAPDPAALLPLACVCVLGFALCPYLDLTFHRARQASETSAASHLAFGVGFGVVFFSMILFTLGYSGVALLQPLRGLALFVLLMHMSIQLAFTIAVHVIEAMSGPLGEKSISRHFPGWDVLAAALAGVALSWVPMYVHEPYHHETPGELIYRLFMAFYGLVFPAYVWLCMLPDWKSPGPPTRRGLALFAAATLLASPFYWLGFIEGKMLWLLPGLLIVLAFRAAVPRSRLPS